MFYISLWAAKGFLLLQKMIGQASNDKSGLGALKLDKNFLKKIQKPPVVIAVTGTNGKTTTCNLLVDLLEDQGFKVGNNRGGSNYQAGVATALLKSVSIFNKTKVDYLVAEYDEISSDIILPAIKPQYLLVSNLFRDSMRRNGHTDFVFNKINQGITKDITLILNADDPISSRLGTSNKKVYFSIDQLETDPKVNHSLVSDMLVCPVCYHLLKYEYVRYHHLGKAYCPKCDFKNPQADYLVSKIKDHEIIIKYKNEKEKYPIVSESIFNIYNLLAATTLLREMNFSANNISDSIKKLKITESRLKMMTVGNTDIIAHMSKGQNPIATSRVFDYVSKAKGTKEIILMIEDINDRRTSSETIAWLYDADFEFLRADDIKRIIVTGVRYHDIVLRLLMAGISEAKIFGTTKENQATSYLEINGTDKIFLLYDITLISQINEICLQIESKIKQVKS